MAVVVVVPVGMAVRVIVIVVAVLVVDVVVAVRMFELVQAGMLVQMNAPVDRSLIVRGLGHSCVRSVQISGKSTVSSILRK